MSEQFILDFIPRRIEELGYKDFKIRYRDFLVEENSSKTILAYNSLYFLAGDPQGVVIESYYGLYDTINFEAEDNIHQHRGEIVITNPGTDKKRIKFIQVIIVA
jgi:hypothetical protein